MELQYASMGLGLIVVMVGLGSGLVSSSIDQDRAECTDQVVGLATCLPYVGGQSKAPTPDCCTGFKLVVQNSKKCLCILIKDRNDPSVDISINLTLALGLPTVCHAPANISQCVDILHLPPNSREAKDFLGLNSPGGNVTSPAAPVSGGSSSKDSEEKSDGGVRKTGLEIERLAWFLVSSLLLTHVVS